MCARCLSRRNLGRGALGLALGSVGARRAAAAAPADAPIEPRLRLPSPPPGARPRVALTFDACPGAFDHRIAAALIEQRLCATIFVTALWMQRNPDALRLLLSEPVLFSLQNHGARHIPPVLGDRRIFGIPVAGDLATIRTEISGGARAITAANGIAPRWYRAATGFYTPSVIPAIEAMGFAIGGYTFSADAGASLPAAQVAARMAAAKDGDVLVAHINQPLRPSGAGVVTGLQALQARGVHFVRLDRVTTEAVG